MLVSRRSSRDREYFSVDKTDNISRVIVYRESLDDLSYLTTHSGLKNGVSWPKLKTTLYRCFPTKNESRK